MICLILKQIICAIQFLTRIPLPIKIEIPEKSFGKSIAFAPLVGAIIGAIMCIMYYLISLSGAVSVAVIMSMATYVVITGALHIDGLGDTFDGLFSNKDKDRMLEIMRDSRMGTNGIVAIFFVLITDIFALSELNTPSILTMLFVMPIIGRLGTITSVSFSKYARSSGMGGLFINNCGIFEFLIGLLITIIIGFLAIGFWILPAILICVMFSFVFIKLSKSKIDGMTGDTCGAVCEICQMLFLVFALFVWK